MRMGRLTKAWASLSISFTPTLQGWHSGPHFTGVGTEAVRTLSCFVPVEDLSCPFSWCVRGGAEGQGLQQHLYHH